MGAACVAGLDIGGTKAAAAWATAEGIRGPTVRRDMVPDSADASLAAAADALRAALAGAPGPLRAIGVGVPAIVDREAGMVQWAPNIPGWNGFPLGERLAEAFGVPVYVDYDGHMAALGEFWLGAGQGVANLVLVTIGTGIGGGIIADGRLLRGSVGVAGALGWMSCPQWESPEATKLGALEALAAGPGILRRARRRGDYSSPPDVFAAARAGDRAASATIAEAAAGLGLGLANVVSILGPEVILIGGGVGAHADLFIPAIERAIKAHAQPFAARAARVATAALGPDAGLVGAARLALGRTGLLPEQW